MKGSFSSPFAGSLTFSIISLSLSRQTLSVLSDKIQSEGPVPSDDHQHHSAGDTMFNLSSF